MSSDTVPLLQMRGITKRFSGVEVLHGADLTLQRGEVLALLGENGAGKSTLMKILNGDYTKDAGEIHIEGRRAEFRAPADAEAAGVQVIYQELNDVPDISVAENVLLGHLPRRAGLLRGVVDWRAAYRQAGELLAAMGAPIDPRAPMRSLRVGERQIVEIAKALSRRARILVMDEPTAALTPREVERLFATIASLKAQGVGIIYISHRLDEVEAVADRITVLRDGSVAGTMAASEASRGAIVHLMIGRDLGTIYPARNGEPGAVALAVRSLTRARAFRDVSFEVRSGEIVALFGLLGAGHEDLTRALFGAQSASGSVAVDGRPVRLGSPRAAKRAGIGLVPQDRKDEGLVLGMSVAGNVTLGNWSQVATAGVVSRSREARRAAHWAEALGIRTPRGLAQEVRTLSGGNQQKVVLARWLEADTRVLLLAEPTRGVDIGARADIYAALESLREQGLAIVLVSSDIEEVLALADRTLVFARGRLAREIPRASASQAALLSAAAGEFAAGDAGGSWNRP